MKPRGTSWTPELNHEGLAGASQLRCQAEGAAYGKSERCRLSVQVSCGCCKQLTQISRLKTTELHFFFFIVLEARSLESVSLGDTG